MAHPDPFRPPDTEKPGDIATSGGIACPSCGNTGSSAVGFTWWGGLLGPRVFSVVKCDGCGTQYNGKTGGSLTGVIIAWNVIAFAVLMPLMLLVLWNL